ARRRLLRRVSLAPPAERELTAVFCRILRPQFAVGDLLIGWRLLVLAGVAHAALADGPSQNDEAFYRGKIAVAAFFAKNMLPKLTGVRSVIENIDDDIMRVPEDAF
ncbi:acyl-CoA dehydrogenase C-terminal domain-containing protein, partial [Mycobacterium tuberculosis]|uniref:acyl-CoA dehydrogenase C-terminal domain-containing protein n=1 Tax=Mycobacterium tuberculosis TaxID=1773 RepID=UPI00202BB35D